MRQRSLEALKQKARRGELFMTVAIGYVQGSATIASRRTRIGGSAKRIALVFRKFAEMQSRASGASVAQAGSAFPLPAVSYGTEGRRIEWKLPVYNTIYAHLTNPIYAGAYAFGRTGSRVSIEDGRKKVVRGYQKGAQGLGGIDPRSPRG